MAGQNVNIDDIANLKNQLDALGEQRKQFKGQLDELEQQAVAALLQMNVRSVGEGPCWALGKHKTDGSFNRERFIEFFGLLAEERQKRGGAMSPADEATLASTYLKKFEKRILVLNKLNKPPAQKGCEDLKEWMATGK
jgi:hypothetical protein